MNKLIITGNLTADPVLRTVTVSNVQTEVANFNVAVNDSRTNKATFFRVTVWRGLAKTCAQYLKKGRKVLVEGPVSINSYSDNSGAWRCDLEVRGENVEFLDSSGKKAEEPEKAPEKAPETASETTEEADIFDAFIE